MIVYVYVSDKIGVVVLVNSALYIAVDAMGVIRSNRKKTTFAYLVIPLSKPYSTLVL